MRYHINAVWLRANSGDKTGSKESPKYDADADGNGFYAMIPNESVMADYVALTSPPISSDNNLRCFSLDYFAHTTSVQDKVLKVDLRDVTKYQKLITSKFCYGTTNSSWTKFNFQFPEHMPLKYSIEISTVFSSKSLLSNLAIDNIKFSFNCKNNDK